MTPIPAARRYSVDTTSDPPVVYNERGHPITPNARKAVVVFCDDGVRRCRTVKRWAELARHRDALDRFLNIQDPDARSSFADNLALDDF